jgi:hypothetical protein
MLRFLHTVRNKPQALLQRPHALEILHRSRGEGAASVRKALQTRILLQSVLLQVLPINERYFETACDGRCFEAGKQAQPSRTAANADDIINFRRICSRGKPPMQPHAEERGGRRLNSPGRAQRQSRRHHGPVGRSRSIKYGTR